MRKNRIFFITLTFFLFINQSLFSKDTIKFESTGKFREILLDPMTTINEMAFILFKNIYDTLVSYDSQKNKILPSLATKWNYNKKTKEWVFELRRKVKFFNGEDFNADTVVLNFQRALKKTHKYRYYELPMFGLLNDYLKDVVKVDKYKVKFVLYKNYSPFLYILTSPIYSIQSVNSIKTNKNILKVKPIGTGPYYIEKINKYRIVLKRNECYWRNTKRVERIELKYTENAVKAVEDVERNRVDGIFSYSILKLPGLRKISYLRVIQKPAFSAIFLVINPRNKYLKNVQFRKALYHLWNPQIIDYVYQGLVIPNSSVIPEGIIGYKNDYGKYDFSLNKAKKILKAMNFKKTELNLILIKDEELALEVYKYYSKILKKVNIKLKIRKLSFNDFTEHIIKGDFDLTQSRWIMDYPDPDDILSALFTKSYIYNSFPNIYFYLNKKLKSLIKKAREETDIRKRRELYEKINGFILSNHYIIPIGKIINIVIINRKIKNLVIDNFRNYDFKNLKYED